MTRKEHIKSSTSEKDAIIMALEDTVERLRQGEITADNLSMEREVTSYVENGWMVSRPTGKVKISISTWHPTGSSNNG